jgi:hypothetical protein
MDTNPTVGDLMETIHNAKREIDRALALLARSDPKALIAPDGNTDSRNADAGKCPLIPQMAPEPIHPGGAHCWLTFPLTIGDVVNPIRDMSEMTRIMLGVLDRVNRNRPLPLEDRGESIP